MNSYLDTNVLVAASVQAHQHHFPALELVGKVKSGVIRGFISTHALAEYYSVLTRAPFIPRIHPADAGRSLEENILPYFELVAISAGDYKTVLRSCANAGFVGGIIFDALHLHCAIKAKCERIYTFNVKDFRALAPKELEHKITAP
ncbi:MAG: type II toxin-antitoxin system VapC family toxin [Bryobacteraceae bacterium]